MTRRGGLTRRARRSASLSACVRHSLVDSRGLIVRPQLAPLTKIKRVDVLADCGKIILYGRDRLKLTTQEVDYLFKKLRKTFEQRDPLTRDWLATDSRARVDFLFNEVLRPAMSEIKLRRWIEQLRAQVGDAEMTDEEVRGESPADRLLPP